MLLVLMAACFFAKAQMVTDGNKSQFFRKEPYMIWTGVNDEMQILWQLYTSYSCSIEWGLDQNYSLGNATTNQYGNDHQHTYIITGLEPDTLYYYRVSVHGDTITGDFRSVPSDDAVRLTFITYGDTRSYPSHHNQVAQQMLSALENDNTAQSFIVFSGDFVKHGDQESDWDQQFFSDNYPYIRKLMTREPYLATMGNHEGNGVLFAKYFPYPFYASGDYYWSFDYGPVHFAIIDQFSPYTVGTPQYQWLVDDLMHTSKQWKFILLHEPGWSAGGGHSNNSTVQNVIQPLCVQYGVQFVIGGHNHYYACAVVDSVVHITSGGGGAPQYTPNPNYPNIIKVKKAYHFCKIDVTEDDLHFMAIDDNGAVIHEFNYTDLFPPANQYDAGCLSITKVPVTNCSGMVAPAVEIKNFGATTLSAININYLINNESLNTYNWFGMLPFNETTTIQLPVVNFTAMNENLLTVYTTNPNGNPDQNPLNDTIYKSFATAEDVTSDVILFLKLDNSPGETSWTLKNSSGEVLYWGDNYVQPNLFIRDTLELFQNDCYHFSIYDEGGNGFSADGYYALFESDLNLIYKNLNFSGSEESVQFSVTTVDVTDNRDQPVINIFAKASEKNIEISFDTKKPENVEIRIVNMMGKEVYRKPLQNRGKGLWVYTVDSGRFAPGIYLVSLKIGQNIFTRKIALAFY